jgi:hypothetical protein
VRFQAWGAAGLCLVAGALAACDTPRPARPALWTLADVQRLYENGAAPTDAIATDAGLPGGVPLGSMLNADDRRSLAVAPAFAESYPVGYVTTEVWAHFPEVWAQPVYVPISGWANGAPQSPLGTPIFSVGADSLFYSPFWQMIYVEIPSDSAKSVREILDGKFPLHPGRPWTAALSPPDFGLGATSTNTAGGAIAGTGWLDGVPAPFIKFPATPFGIGDDNVVQEVPIFHFVVVDDHGAWIPAPVPTVLGTGPLYAHIPAPVDNIGIPTPGYSGYWRVYVVVLPPTARAFAPPDSPLAMTLASAKVPVDAMYGSDVVAAANAGQLDDLFGRVALNSACFDSMMHVDPMNGSCRYLDSQDAIERRIPTAAIVPTDVTVTCPIVSITGLPVQP